MAKESTIVECVGDMIKSITRGEESRLVYGDVVSTNPLTIRIDNQDDPLPSSFFELCENALGRWDHVDSVGQITVDGTTYQVITETEEKVWVFRGLRSGDRVSMVSTNHNQKYYILDRK